MLVFMLYFFHSYLAELQNMLKKLSSVSSEDDIRGLLSEKLSGSQADQRAKKFVEDRIKLLIRGYESRLAKIEQLVCISL